jgi:hypothetical protein
MIDRFFSQSYISVMANQSDNRRSRFVSLRIPHEIMEQVEAVRVPGQSLAYLLVEAIRNGISRVPMSRWEPDSPAPPTDQQLHAADTIRNIIQRNRT